MRLVLIRVGQSDKGTFGVLRYGVVPFALTLERPWLDNAANVSSIPSGVYECQRVHSIKFGNTFEVTGVPNRSHILFHKGNTIHDTQGCILVGEEFAGSYDVPALANSKHGFDEFLSLLYGRTLFELVVIDPPTVMDEEREG
jgi:hypothetical protein